MYMYMFIFFIYIFYISPFELGARMRPETVSEGAFVRILFMLPPEEHYYYYYFPIKHAHEL